MVPICCITLQSEFAEPTIPHYKHANVALALKNTGEIFFIRSNIGIGGNFLQQIKPTSFWIKSKMRTRFILGIAIEIIFIWIMNEIHLILFWAEDFVPIRLLWVRIGLNKGFIHVSQHICSALVHIFKTFLDYTENFSFHTFIGFERVWQALPM